MTVSYESEQAIAIEAVRSASALCRAVRAEISPESLSKRDQSPVTVADFGAQALICRTLAEAFPGDPVIAEEDSTALQTPDNAAMLDRVIEHVRRLIPDAERHDVLRWLDHGGARGYSDRFWTLDPIDGTKGFLRGGQYAVALALIVGGRVEVAALACPSLPFVPRSDGPVGTIFSAIRGQGTRARPLEEESPVHEIRVSDQDDAASARFCESVESGHSAHGESAAIAERLGIITPPVRLDSQAKYAVVARGEAEIYLRLPTRADYREKIWDHAAGALIVEEAGGVVTDVAGRPLDFTHGSELAVNRGVIVSNGRFHERVLNALG